MDLKIIDAHTHVQFPQFDADRDEVLSRAFENGIGMIQAGADIESSQKAIQLAHSHEYVWATTGIHPTEMPAGFKAAISTLRDCAIDERAVGIGECGLDYFRLNEEREKAIAGQKELFEYQIELAGEINKPLILHVRPSSQKSQDAFEDVLKILHAHKNEFHGEPGICHFFTGTKEIARQFLELGFSFTFGGLITYNREFDEVLSLIPSDRMLVETDAPFVAPKSHRGHRNEPSFVAETAEFLADFKKIPTGTFLENTKRIFNL